MTKMRDAKTTTMDAMSDTIFKLDAFRKCLSGAANVNRWHINQCLWILDASMLKIAPVRSHTGTLENCASRQTCNNTKTQSDRCVVCPPKKARGDHRAGCRKRVGICTALPDNVEQTHKNHKNQHVVSMHMDHVCTRTREIMNMVTCEHVNTLTRTRTRHQLQ